MRLKINKDLPFPVYLQIKNSIKEQVLTGVLPPGFVLPPERKLADSNGVSRTTVIRAYDELKALGLVESYRGKGTVVTEKREPDTSNEQSHVFPLSWYPLFDKKLGYVSDTITDIMNVGHQKNMISFAAGVGDPDLYPIKQLKAIQDESAYNSEVLNLCPVEGYYPLRESLSRFMQLRSLSVSPKEVMILSGSMQGIDFTARTFLSPGDAVVVEEPTFLQAIQCFRATGAKIIGIPLDDEGIRTDVLEAQLSRYKPKFIYTIPTFHNPTGIVMSMKRKMELLHLAYKYQVPILEDDPYGEISFDQQERPPLKALDRYDYVIYLGTFSKVLFSGTRVGWVIGPEPVMKKFALLKQITDLHVNTPGQFVLDRYIREGYYEAHLRNELAVYKKKRDFMAAALKRDHELIAFNVPDGGYYLWCRIPKQVSQKELLSLCASKGVLFTPGTVFYPQESDGVHFLRVNYTYESFERITKGAAVLLEALGKLKGRETEDRVHRENRPIV